MQSAGFLRYLVVWGFVFFLISFFFKRCLWAFCVFMCFRFLRVLEGRSRFSKSSMIFFQKVSYVACRVFG